MPPQRAFSALSWNVEHFRLKDKDVDGIIEHIRTFDPDVLAIYEVEGKYVYSHMVENFPGYNFHITEGRQTQEILLGARGSLTSFFSQRLEFKTGNDFLRPGALLSIRIKDVDYSLLFLHTRSFQAPIGFGTRDSQFRHAFNLKKTLDKIDTGGNARFIIVGDMNTMGMTYPFKKSIADDIELQKIDRDAEKRSMRRLAKTSDRTWTNTKTFSDLDHVIASTSVKFKSQGDSADVRVSGWLELADSQQEFEHFVRHISDHNSLYFEVK